MSSQNDQCGTTPTDAASSRSTPTVVSELSSTASLRSSAVETSQPAAKLSVPCSAEIVLRNNQLKRKHRGNKQLARSQDPSKDERKKQPKYNKGPKHVRGAAVVEVKSNCKITHTFSSVPTPSADWSKQVFSMSEIAKHNRADDCWLVVRGQVYDVTSMVAQHPGSGRAILRHAGQICDEDFEFHSKAARTFWKKHYCIGYLEGSEPKSFLGNCSLM